MHARRNDNRRWVYGRRVPEPLKGERTFAGGPSKRGVGRLIIGAGRTVGVASKDGFAHCSIGGWMRALTLRGN